MAIVTFRSESVLKGGLSVENRAGKFTVLMDEPETLRGTDTGMNSVEMLLLKKKSRNSWTSQKAAVPSTTPCSGMSRLYKRESSSRGDAFLILVLWRVAKGGVRVHHRVPGAFRAVVGRPDAPAARADELEQGASLADTCAAAQAWGENGFRPANLTSLDFGPHAIASLCRPRKSVRNGPQGRSPAGRPPGSPRFTSLSPPWPSLRCRSFWLRRSSSNHRTQ